MKINHRPILDTARVIAEYQKRDGVPIKYVCTTALNHGSLAADIFFRDTPHPTFGNRYFGLYRNQYADNTVIEITNADCIEQLMFNMVEVNGQYHYSQHRHDYNEVEDIAIDGGRAYFKLTGNLNHDRMTFIVRDGKFEDVNRFKGYLPSGQMWIGVDKAGLCQAVSVENEPAGPRFCSEGGLHVYLCQARHDEPHFGQHLDTFDIIKEY